MNNSVKKQPSSLKIYFGTEMWERYGFYVVQTLLAIYLTGHLHWEDSRVYPLVGAFTALTYLSPVFGGMIADKLLGQKTAVMLGVITLFASYCLLTFLKTQSALAASLAGIAVGTGLLKPNISSLLGNEYPEVSSRRESGFTIFYMGITLGIVLGTTIPSQLERLFGWQVAFGSAFIGLFLALFVYGFGLYFYPIHDYNPSPHRLSKSVLALVSIVLLWIMGFYILSYSSLAEIVFLCIVILSTVYIIKAARKAEKQQAIFNYLIGLLCIISVIFWTFYFQMFLSLTLFIERVVEPHLAGLYFPPPYYVTIQSLGMLGLGFFLSKNRSQQDLKKQASGIAKKFIIAIVFTFVAYSIILLSCYFTDVHQPISPLNIIPAYLMLSVAELLLSPVGLSAMTFLASRDQVSTMMGIFFVSLGMGGFLAGKIADLTSVNQPEKLSLSELHLHYTQSFQEVWIMLLLSTVLCFFVYFIYKLLLKRVQ